MATLKFLDYELTFGDLIAATGADLSWFKTIVARDREQFLGIVHRSRRRMYSLKDIGVVTALWQLHKSLKMPPAAAWEVARAVPGIINGVGGELMDVNIRIAFTNAGEVLIWTVDKAGVIVTWNDIADSSQFIALTANQGPHIVFPLRVIFESIYDAMRIFSDVPAETVAAKETAR